jgi:hypothetical protein
MASPGPLPGRSTLPFCHLLHRFPSPRSATDSVPPQYLKCSQVQAEGRPEQRLLQCFFGFEQLNLFTTTGKKLVIKAESGERLELNWTMDWLERGRIIPRWLYALDYIRPDGRGGDLPAVRIGECHFSQGCNYGEFLAPDENGNGIPDLFARIVWDSWDYGNDNGVPGYLDHIRHVYIRETDTYIVTRYLCQYPAACRLPMSPPADVCRVSAACKPPYVLTGQERLESRRLHPSSGLRPQEH